MSLLHKNLQVSVHLQIFRERFSSAQLIKDLCMNPESIGTPTSWNSFFLCAQRMVKIEDPLNVTLTQADRKDLVLGKLEILLLKDLISELKQFYTITNMVCTNTQYSFNNYTPMMEIIETMLSKKDVDAEINHTQTITDFRNIMLKQFSSYK